MANRSQARLLAIREGDALLCFQRVTYRENGQPLELVDAAYRADRYSFSLTLRR